MTQLARELASDTLAPSALSECRTSPEYRPGEARGIPVFDMTQSAVGLSKVLVAIDGSEFSAGAIRVATELARAPGALLVVLNVLPARHGSDVMGVDTRLAEQEEALKLVQGTVAGVEASGVKTLAVTHRGRSPAQGIVTAAKEHNADMIVIGRRGKYSLARAMLGGAVAKVIGSALCPVLVTPRASKMWERRILLATDGSPASETATKIAARLARARNLPLTVVSVEVPKHSPERQAEAAKIVERTVAALRAEGIDADGKVGHGLPPDEIQAIVGETGADLIVIGSEGRTGLGRVLLGSNSEAVIARTTCPVLVATAAMAGSAAVQPLPEAEANGEQQ
jgi:nucleotide-binding universal stress UspA family protein